MYDSILRDLPKLSTDELLALRNHITALLSLEGRREEDRDSGNDWLLGGILWFLDEEGLGETVPERFVVTNRRQYHGYLPKSEKIRKLFEAQTSLTKVDKIALGRLLARCLADYIKEWATPGLGSLLRHADLMLPAFEHAFPGYLKSGLLKVVLRGVLTPGNAKGALDNEYRENRQTSNRRAAAPQSVGTRA